MKRLISQIVFAALGLWLAAMYVPGVIIRVYPTSNFFGFALTQTWEIIVVLGIVLGLLNYFLKPVLQLLTLPLQIVTLGLFTIFINMALLWLLDQIFDELYIPLFLPLLYTALIIWGLNSIVDFFIVKKEY